MATWQILSLIFIGGLTLFTAFYDRIFAKKQSVPSPFPIPIDNIISPDYLDLCSIFNTLMDNVEISEKAATEIRNAIALKIMPSHKIDAE